MNSIVSAYNGIPLAKPSVLSDKEWEKTTRSLMQSHGGRLFNPFKPVEKITGTMGVPDSPHIEFEADRAKSEKKRQAAVEKAAQASGSLVE